MLQFFGHASQRILDPCETILEFPRWHIELVRRECDRVEARAALRQQEVAGLQRDDLSETGLESGSNSGLLKVV